MKYREKILEIVLNYDFVNENDENDPLMDWIETMPLMEQPDILREFELLLRELADENGISAKEIPILQNFSAIIEEFEDSVLDEKLYEAKLSMAQDQEEIDSIEREYFRAQVRLYLMDCIVNDQEDAYELLAVTKKIILVEKENGRYDPENWSRILHLIDSPS